jgi:hypothetical protein
MKFKVSDVVKKDRFAYFSFYRQGYLYYNIQVWGKTVEGDDQLQLYCFPVLASDLGGATVNAIEKSVTMMRYIRKALQDETFVRAQE